MHEWYLIRFYRSIFLWVVFVLWNVSLISNFCGKPQKTRIWHAGHEGNVSGESGFARKTESVFHRRGTKAQRICHKDRKAQRFFTAEVPRHKDFV
jgi:hypothetical protein